MTKEELLTKLAECARMADEDDPEMAHVDADEALLVYIDDPKVTQAFNSIYPRWYA